MGRNGEQITTDPAPGAIRQPSICKVACQTTIPASKVVRSQCSVSARESSPLSRCRERMLSGHLLSDLKELVTIGTVRRQDSFNPGAVDLPHNPALAQHPWHPPLPSFTARQKNILLPPLLAASPSVSGRCVRRIRNRRFLNGYGIRKRCIGHDHVLGVGCCFSDGEHGPRNIFARTNRLRRRLSDRTFGVRFRDIVWR